MKKYLITSALPYVNGLPHLGHLIGCLLPSDVYARFLRQKGENVLYICGTDEHGTPSEVGAAKENMPVEDYCTKYHNLHAEMYKGFNLSFDYFGRTCSEQNKEIVYRIFNELDKNGLISEKVTRQVYSVDDGRYLPDSYVMGTCPHCGYEKAKGDQCENCTKVLDPIDLIKPRSVISGSENLEIRETKHLFLQLPKLEKELTEWIETKKGIWPDIAYSIAQKWLKEGLQERGITRDLKWGFAVPKEGFDGKVFYVWFDAPIGYIGITKQWADEQPSQRCFEDWWLDKENVIHTEFMGKDNIPFHTITFPATLRGTGENWTEVSMLKGMNYLNFAGGKFSKSAHRGIFLDDAIKEFPADYWRYWLIANAPESDDSNFSFDQFATTVNKDLNDVLGNFINRVLKMTVNNFGQNVPPMSVITDSEKELYSTLDTLIETYTKHMHALEFRKAMSALREIWVSGNNYLAKTEPWKVVKTDMDYAGTILNTALNLIRLYAQLSAPIMPQTAQQMLDLFEISDEFVWPNLKMADYLMKIPTGTPFKLSDPLFQKIMPDKLSELKITYKEDE
ncbi:MAG: methionine--tRNA ligase [Alphaproteobacteria bacterium]|nr:methionine--tRNA ligase [Alphaproteobacteria bacterium]MBQ3118127.1 methionine--tRNA ligase [Alphaproteobacteria bacterium]MBQ6854590.1 methionine--tRNA ligase [Alphaproteobacteria bacterium]MBQ8557732.1 methionine--tRNA ligase [Alphaproteobacteria bacterium]